MFKAINSFALMSVSAVLLVSISSTAHAITPISEKTPSCKTATKALIDYLASTPERKKKSDDASPYESPPEASQYWRDCPDEPYIYVRALGNMYGVVSTTGSDGVEDTVASVTSSNQKVIALSKPKKEKTADGLTYTSIQRVAVGIGQSTVCTTYTSGSKFCELNVVPPAIAGFKSPASAMVNSFLDIYAFSVSGVPKLTKITSTNPRVMPIRGLSTAPKRPGKSTICTFRIKLPKACQKWTILK